MGITDIILTLAPRTAITVQSGSPAACSSARVPGMADTATTGAGIAGIGMIADGASTHVATLGEATDERVSEANTVSAAMTFAAGAAKAASEAANPTVGEVSTVGGAGRKGGDTAKIFSQKKNKK